MVSCRMLRPRDTQGFHEHNIERIPPDCPAVSELLMRRALPIAVNQNCRQGRPISVSEEHSDSLQMSQRKIISMKPGIRTIAILTALLGFGLLNGGRAADVKDEKKPAAAKKELFKNLSVA